MAQAPTSTGYGVAMPVFWAGFVIFPLSVGSFVANRLVRRLSRRINLTTLLPIGAGAMTAAGGLLWFAHSGLWEILLGMLVLGLGMGTSYAAMPALIARSVATEELGSSVSFNQVLRTVGSSLGTAVTGAVLSATMAPDLHPSGAGISATVAIGALLCAVVLMALLVHTSRAVISRTSKTRISPTRHAPATGKNTRVVSPHRWPKGFAAAVCSFVVVFAAGASPLPLYDAYRREGAVMTDQLALMTVSYFGAAVATLLVLGRLSIYVGRRAVAVAALVFATGGCAALLDVHSVFPLIVGRALLGIATGLATSALASYVVDTSPLGPVWLGPLAAATAPMVGTTIGALGSGALAASGLMPRELPYLIAMVPTFPVLLRSSVLWCPGMSPSCVIAVSMPVQQVGRMLA